MSVPKVKKTLMLLVCLCVTAALVLPVSAKVIDYNDYITDESVDGENNLITVCFPAGDMNAWYIQSSSGGTTYCTFPGDWYDTADIPSTVSTYRAVYYPIDQRHLIDIQDIPNGTTINLRILIESDQYVGGSCYGSFEIRYYDLSGSYLGNSTVKDTAWDPSSGNLLALSIDLNKPDKACYIKVMAIISRCENVGNCTVVAEDLYFTMSINSLLRMQQETGRTNALLQEILDEMRSEENKANNAGSAGVGDLTDAIPNYSAGFMDAMQGLASSMSYNGTEAKFNVPKASVPGIDGLFDSFDIMDGSMEIDFEDYIQMMPDYILLLVQSLLTIALIVYCFKELYGTIMYVLTLKGGD